MLARKVLATPFTLSSSDSSSNSSININNNITSSDNTNFIFYSMVDDGQVFYYFITAIHVVLYELA